MPTSACKKNQTYNITLTNTGSQSWNNSAASPSCLSFVFASAIFLICCGWPPLLRSFPTRRSSDLASTTVSVTVTAPAGAGPYVLRHRLVKDGIAWFDQVQKTDVKIGRAHV